MSNESSEKITVSIIEDSEIHYEWLKERLLESQRFDVIAIDKLGRDGLDTVKKYNPRIVLLDFQLADITGLEVAKRIKAFSSDIKVFALTAHTEAAIIGRIVSDKHVDALAIKGSYYFEENFISALCCVAEGGAYIDPSLFNTLRNFDKTNGLNKLTNREFEVFIQTNAGKTDKEIATDLCVEELHVKNLKSRISKKIKSEKLDNLLSRILENAN